MTAEEKVKVLEDALKESQAEVEALKATKSEATPTVKMPNFKTSDATFEFVCPKFEIEGKKYTAEEVKDDKELCALIVKNYSGLVRKLK